MYISPTNLVKVLYLIPVVRVLQVNTQEGVGILLVNY